MGHNPPLRPHRPSDVTAPDEASIRIEALHIARSMPDAHGTDTLLDNAHKIRDWIAAGRPGEPRAAR